MVTDNKPDKKSPSQSGDKADESFLSRWSRRKVEVARATAPAPIPPPQPMASPALVSARAGIGEQNPSIGAVLEAKMPQDARSERTLTSEAPTPPLPSVESLTRESDFAPFMRADVSPEMRNLAMKKLFTDPHYNVMDRLDIYIDDYGKPDPIPPEMLRMMNQSKSLGLFEEEERAEEEALKTARGESAADKIAADLTSEAQAIAAPDPEMTIEAKPAQVDADNLTFPFAPAPATPPRSTT